MSQNESKSKGSSLLMPLAIGGGLLLLFMGMKKAKAQGEGSLPALPEMDSNQASPQIVPEAAPKYTDLVDDEEGDGASNAASYSPSQSSSANYNSLPSNSFDEEDDTTDSYGNERQGSKIVGNGKPKMGMKQYADRNVNPKAAKMNAMRSQSDQTKLAQQKARSNKPVFSPIPFIEKTQKAIAQKIAVTKIFPLKQGQTNNYIKELQRKIGVSPTGFFGTQTKAALLKKYRAVEVNEALYKQIMTGKAATIKPIIPFKMKAPLVKSPIKILPKKKILVKKR